MPRRTRKPDLDLGSGHTARWFVWKPDRRLNPQYRGIPNVDPAGVIIDHPRLDNGEPCSGAVTFDVESMRELYGSDMSVWQVVSLDPLHIEPSVLCSPDRGGCGDHGWIRDGKWVNA